MNNDNSLRLYNNQIQEILHTKLHSKSATNSTVNESSPYNAGKVKIKKEI